MSFDIILEFTAVISGIYGVYLNKKENFWGFPIGLINTIIYIYICFTGSLFGEALVNFYYTITALYGWYLWAQKKDQKTVLKITRSSTKDLIHQFVFFGICFGLLYGLLFYLKNEFSPNALPFFDSLSSATAFTGMWLLAKKKLENWLWWIATNVLSIFLFIYKDKPITSIQYFVFLIIAVFAYFDWKKKLKN